jgi:hypothetical protein
MLLEMKRKAKLIVGLVTIITITAMYMIIFMVFAGAPTSFYEVRNNDNETHEVIVDIKGINETEMYILGSNGFVKAPKTCTIFYDNSYQIDVYLDGKLENSEKWNLTTYDTVVYEIRNGKIEAGVLAV